MNEQEQEQARLALAESFRRERAERKAQEQRAGPPKERPRWMPQGRAFGWLIGIVAMVIVAAPITIVFVHVADAFGIADGVKQFCVAAAVHDYDSAYGHLSQDAQRRLSRDEFASAAGAMATCDLAERAYWADVQGDRASIHVSFFMKNGDDPDTKVTRTVTVHRENGSWHLEAVDDETLRFLPAAAFLNS